MFIESVIPSTHLILCRPLLLLPSIFPNIRVFSNESVLHMKWSKYRSFSFNISPSNEYLGLISFRIDWLDLLAIQGSQESSPTPQFKSISSLAISLPYSQLSYPYMTPGKTIALTRQTFVSKVMSLLFNTLCRLAIAFLSRSKWEAEGMEEEEVESGSKESTHCHTSHPFLGVTDRQIPSAAALF